MLQPRDIEDFLNCMLDMALVEAGAQSFPLLDVVHIFGHRYDQAADKPNYAVGFPIAAISVDLKHVRVSGAEHAVTVAVTKSSTGTIKLMDEMDKMCKSSGVHLAMPSYLLIKVHIFQWEIRHGANYPSQQVDTFDGNEKRRLVIEAPAEANFAYLRDPAVDLDQLEVKSFDMPQLEVDQAALDRLMLTRSCESKQWL